MTSELALNRLNAMLSCWENQSKDIPILKGMHLAEAMQRWDLFLDNPQGKLQNEIDGILADDIFDIDQDTIKQILKALDRSCEIWSYRHIIAFLDPRLGYNNSISICRDARMPFSKIYPTDIQFDGEDDEDAYRGHLYLLLLSLTHEIFLATRQLDGDEGGECRIIYLLPTTQNNAPQEVSDLINDSYCVGPNNHVEDPNYSFLGYNQMKAIIEKPELFYTIWCGAY